MNWVLIDTWWNVNAGVWTIGYGHTGVLIDTWWNVNAVDGCRTTKTGWF